MDLLHLHLSVSNQFALPVSMTGIKSLGSESATMIKNQKYYPVDIFDNINTCAAAINCTEVRINNYKIYGMSPIHMMTHYHDVLPLSTAHIGKFLLD